MQVIVFYRPNKLPASLKEIATESEASQAADIPNYIWTSEYIQNPWPRTDDPQKMIEEIQEIFNKRELSEGFQVCVMIVVCIIILVSNS